MKERDASRQDIWICGVNPVREALRSMTTSVREMVISRADSRLQELLDLAAARKVPVRQERREAMSALLGHGHHQGVALRASEHPYMALEEILERPLSEREPLVVLDSIQDPQNFGALLRSACFLGAKGIVIPKDRSVRMTGTVVKVSAGATSYLPVILVTNLARSLDHMKKSGLWIVGLDVEGSSPIHGADLSVPLALLIGNEQKGLRSLIRKQCDLLVQIPSHGPIQSLNAAVSGAVALAEVQRQRDPAKR